MTTREEIELAIERDNSCQAEWAKLRDEMRKLSPMDEATELKKILDLKALET